MISEVLKRRELQDRPPVLIDIGASGRLHEEWKPLARHSICIAFDADARDFATERAHPYRTLHLHNAIVSAEANPELEFFLTRSPHCSSSLVPRNEELAAWQFAELFDVVDKVKLPARTLPDILREHRLDYVDWFKTDSQGTDLRLFLSLGDSILRRVLTASFEPGILDAYHGEDKLHAILAKMEQLPFWMDDLDVRGTQRLSRQLWESRVRERARNRPPGALRNSPGWAEVSYLNTLEGEFDLRDHLLAWTIATMKGQFGFALEIALRGEQRFHDSIFTRMSGFSLDSTVGLADRVLPTVAKKALALLRHTAIRYLRA